MKEKVQNLPIRQCFVFLERMRTICNPLITREWALLNFFLIFELLF
jgi:hypothetical protein